MSLISCTYLTAQYAAETLLVLDYCNLSCVLTKPSFYPLVHGCTEVFSVCVSAY